MGHDYIGHNTMGHNYIGNDYIDMCADAFVDVCVGVCADIRGVVLVGMRMDVGIGSMWTAKNFLFVQRCTDGKFVP